MAKSQPVYGVSTNGCAHYKRKCQFLTPCCKGRVYTCRFCHDEAEDHVLDRTKVQQIVCVNCHIVQKVSNRCVVCGIVFGRYFCPVCRLYDDEDKNQFHCDSCGICRIGGRDRFFHCPICDMCLSIRLIGNHKCIEKSSRGNCPVCLDDLHTSRIPCHVPPCGHLLHRNCYDDLIKSSNYVCPICSTSMVDMRSAWQNLDQEVASTSIPTEYVSLRVGILCRDCHRESVVGYHAVGLKCIHCGSYNTCRADNTQRSRLEGRSSSSSLLSEPSSLLSDPSSLPDPRQSQLQSLFLCLMKHLREVQLNNSNAAS